MIVEISTAATSIAAVAGLAFIMLDRIEKMRKRLPYARVASIRLHEELALIQLELKPGEDACAEIVVRAEGLPLTGSVRMGEYGEPIAPTDGAQFSTSVLLAVDLPPSVFPIDGRSICFAVKLRANQSALLISLTNPRASRWAKASIHTAINRTTD